MLQAPFEIISFQVVSFQIIINQIHAQHLELIIYGPSNSEIARTFLSVSHKTISIA